MLDIKISPLAEWAFGQPCEGCGAPMVHFCPLCGADLFVVGHGAVRGHGLPEGVSLSVCGQCLDRLNAGDKPPFWQPGNRYIKCE
jgi:hypothetical protein